MHSFVPMGKAHHIFLSYPHQTSMNISVKLKIEVMITAHFHFSNIAISHLTICLPHLLSHTQYMPGTLQGAWGMSTRSQHFGSSQFNEGGRHIGRQCQLCWLSTLIEVHKENREEVLESLLTESDTLLLNFTQNEKAGDPPGFGYQLYHLAQVMFLLSHM